MIRPKIVSAAASLALLLAPSFALAVEGNVAENKDVFWSFDGPFGTYDKDALQRGFQVYRMVCASCHALEHVSFRNLGDRGGPFHLARCPEGVPETVDCSNPNQNPIVQALAREYQIADGPDDTGEMFERAGLPSDKIPRPYANEQQARLANNGAMPPDLSLVVKARPDGADYVYSLLTGFQDMPAVVNAGPGQYYNPWFPGDLSQLLKEEYRDEEGHPRAGVEVPPGGLIAMAPPLRDGIVDYADPNTPETVDQYAKDVVEFLSWAAEPKLEARKRLGFVTLAYLLVLAGLLYWSYRKVWARVAH